MSLSAPFFVLLLLYAQGEYGENVLTLRPAPVAAFAATLLSALLWTLCWRAPRRAAEPEAYDDGYADGDYERGRRSMETTTIMTSRTAMTIRRSAASATSAIVRPRSARRSIRRA